MIEDWTSVQEEEESAAEAMEWVTDETAAGERLDKVLAEKAGASVSRSQAQQWIKEGAVTVNGAAAAKSNLKLSLGDHVIVTIPDPEPAEIKPEPIPLDVYFEDADVIIVNKPRGLVVHPAPGHTSGTLVNALMYHCKDLSGINGTLRPGIVHRIDKDTTGLLMAAKHDAAHLSLSRQLKEHTATRKYIAVVQGVMHHDQGTIDAPIGRDSGDRKMYTVTNKNSRHAVTHFKVLERFKENTLVELRLETGRTHQIRVHMKFIGHALVGDPMYARTKAITLEGGQALHAAVLGFVHPRTEEYMEFEAPLPDDMADLLHRLRTM